MRASAAHFRRRRLTYPTAAPKGWPAGADGQAVGSRIPRPLLLSRQDSGRDFASDVGQAVVAAVEIWLLHRNPPRLTAGG